MGEHTFALTNACLVTPDAVVEGATLLVEDGVIAALGESAPHPANGTIDCAGDVVMPGIIDVHTDHFETHVYPRRHVRWDPLAAALAHDAQTIGGGITTSFASLTVGTLLGDESRAAVLIPMVEALERGTTEGMFRADHYVHLRCETSDPELPALLEGFLAHPAVRLASLMDHTAGQKQNRDVEAFIGRRMRAWGKTRAQVEAEIAETNARPDDFVPRIRQKTVAMLTPLKIPLMSHDDGTAAHIDEAQAEGVTIAEFPTTVEAARAARAAGMGVVAGAPNVVRGGSQTGNVAVADLLAEGLVDVLASDYVPRAILDAVFQVADDPAFGVTLPEAVAMATKAPADMAGLSDRGRLQVGQRADLLRVARRLGQPFVRAAWRAGARVA